LGQRPRNGSNRSSAGRGGQRSGADLRARRRGTSGTLGVDLAPLGLFFVEA